MMAEEPRNADTPRSVPPPSASGPAPSAASRPSRAHTVGTWLGIAVVVLVVAAFVVFVLQNTGRIVISFLGWHHALPLSLALLAAAAAGIFIAAIISFIQSRRRRHRAKSTRR